jgi:hypothetical protein
MTADWNISGPIDYAWTPAELAQIARAAQAFQAMLPNATGGILHLVRLDGVTVLDGSVVVDWPQPSEESSQDSDARDAGWIVDAAGTRLRPL